MVQNVSVIYKNAIKLFQDNSIVYVLHNKKLSDRLCASRCYLGCNSWLTS